MKIYMPSISQTWQWKILYYISFIYNVNKLSELLNKHQNIPIRGEPPNY